MNRKRPASLLLALCLALALLPGTASAAGVVSTVGITLEPPVAGYLPGEATVPETDGIVVTETRWYMVRQGGTVGVIPAAYVDDGTEYAPARFAYASTQAVELDGKKVEFQMYALKDADGNLTNYVKVWDLALALNGTKAQFSVEWNGAVNLVAGAAYSPNGSENKTPFSGDRTYTVPTSPTNVNGSASDLQAIFLVDDNGDGYTYYKLRDLGSRLGFNVGYSAGKGVFIEIDKPYSGN